MKKFFLFALLVSIAFAGCKKDEAAKPSYNADVTINNVKTSFTDLMFVLETTSKIYSISNYGEADENELSVYLSNPVIGDNGFSLFNSVVITIGEKTYHSATGKINVTKKDDSTVNGTFAGKFTINSDSVSISGNFSSQKMPAGSFK